MAIDLDINIVSNTVRDKTLGSGVVSTVEDSNIYADYTIVVRSTLPQDTQVFLVANELKLLLTSHLRKAPDVDTEQQPFEPLAFDVAHGEVRSTMPNATKAEGIYDAFKAAYPGFPEEDLKAAAQHTEGTDAWFGKAYDELGMANGLLDQLTLWECVRIKLRFAIADKLNRLAHYIQLAAHHTQQVAHDAASTLRDAADSLES